MIVNSMSSLRRIPRSANISLRALATHSSSQPSSTPDSTLSQKKYDLKASTILTRRPLLTRPLSVFEKEYYNYVHTLYNSSSREFVSEFWTKKGAHVSSTETSPSASESEDVTSESKSSSNESQSSESTSSPSNSSTQKSTTSSEQDYKSLTRSPHENLYLIVKKERQNHSWQFPQGHINIIPETTDNSKPPSKHEPLHVAAKRELLEECGKNMDVWMVGKMPIGVYTYDYQQPSKTDKKRAEKASAAKIFFHKAHILSGRPQPDMKEVSDYAWVTKSELKNYVDKEYFENVVELL
ncbi:hypothetical protein BKA69DRAFT_1038150 [Paraphysoderma sedebokerense]|nr:hypothetical protein BKA69DRAFT_1038150 [Paraphysoderma sedebokerense]